MDKVELSYCWRSDGTSYAEARLVHYIISYSYSISDIFSFAFSIYCFSKVALRQTVIIELQIKDTSCVQFSANLRYF